MDGEEQFNFRQQIFVGFWCEDVWWQRVHLVATGAHCLWRLVEQVSNSLHNSWLHLSPHYRTFGMVGSCSPFISRLQIFELKIMTRPLQTSQSWSFAVSGSIFPSAAPQTTLQTLQCCSCTNPGSHLQLLGFNCSWRQDAGCQSPYQIT